jgi:hypothetical protein
VVVVSPTTLPEPPALEAATIAADLAAKDGVCHGAPNHRRGNVVEKRGQHEHHREQRERTLRLSRQVLWEHCGNMAFLEVLGQQCKAQQQAQQIGKNDPLMAQVADQAWQAIAGLEPGERQFVQRDRSEANKCHLQRVVVEQRDTE